MWLQNLVLLSCLVSSTTASSTLLDADGTLKLESIPSSVTTEGLVAVISSPGTSESPFPKSDVLLSLESTEPPCLACRGPTLSDEVSEMESTSMSVCSVVAAAVVVDGVTEGDVEAGLQNSRHALALTSLFRARISLDSDSAPSNPQALFVRVDADSSEGLVDAIKTNIISIFDATASEKSGSLAFENLYDLQILFSDDLETSMSTVSDAAKSKEGESVGLSAALLEAKNHIQDSGVAKKPLDPPQIAEARLAVGSSYSKQSRSARAQVAAWRSRSVRGLLIDGFGKEALALQQKTLSTFDQETLSSSGLTSVSPYRLEMRTKLESFVNAAIEEIFKSQVSNLEKATLKSFRAKLLRNLDANALEVNLSVEENAVDLRAASFTFESAMEDLEVPSLALSKDPATRAMAAKLNDVLSNFPDSAAAKLKRTKGVKKVVKRDRKPSQRAIDFGLDLVAMLRPDGFGSLQGFAGYQLGGNSVTFGIHNDADDPQVIAQFGGVRPPLLRVQPKLRVDVEM